MRKNPKYLLPVLFILSMGSNCHQDPSKGFESVAHNQDTNEVSNESFSESTGRMELIYQNNCYVGYFKSKNGTLIVKAYLLGPVTEEKYSCSDYPDDIALDKFFEPHGELKVLILKNFGH